ncbi:MAG: endonuclease domain-containing protein [Sphingobacteriales bacterium]|nr:MAG: endonuclease domain-containing protein [Sphingobacteriales bacterium]
MKAPGKQYAYHTSDYRKYKNRLGFAQDNRRNPTSAEKILWERLKGRRLGGFKFRRQHVVREYIVDFVCLQRLLIVEIDGGIHQEGENPQRDRDREADLQAMGFKIIRFTNEQVIGETESVCTAILKQLRALPDA